MPSLPMLMVGIGIPAPAGGFCAAAPKESVNINKAVMRVNEAKDVVGACIVASFKFSVEFHALARSIATISGNSENQRTRNN